MSRRRKPKHRNQAQPQQQAAPADSVFQSTWVRATGAVLAVAAVGVAALYLLSREQRQYQRARPSSSHAAASRNTDSTGADAGGREKKNAAESRDSSPKAAEARDGGSAVGFDKLKGRWGRTDSGYEYTIDVTSVDADGTLQAAYNNPKPIRVSQAKATRDGDALKVFIELRDVGYPGCTYHLDYRSAEDQLVGVYYQAALQQQFDVVFVRLTPP